MKLEDLPAKHQAAVMAQLSAGKPLGLARAEAVRQVEVVAMGDAGAFFVAHGLPAPVAEYRFASPRRWRFDYAWLDHRVALEVEGGIWTGGRHTRGAGFKKDMEKYNAAAVLGWRVVRTVPRELTTPATVELVRQMIWRKP